MTVKELIAELRKVDENLVVNVGTSDVYPEVHLQTFTVQPGDEGEGTTQLAICATAASSS